MKYKLDLQMFSSEVYKYQLNSGWTATSGYGTFNVSGKYFSASGRWTSSFSSIAIGKWWSNESNSYRNEANYMSFYSSAYGHDNYTYSRVIIQFDVMPTGSLLTWLNSNATRVRTSTLANTKWAINSSPSFSMGDVIDYSINFLSNNANFNSLYLNRDSGDEIAYINSTTNPFDWRLVYDFSNSSWLSQAYRIIEITGGTDVTNANLIAWLEANATMVECVDLTNTKWVIKDTPTFTSYQQASAEYYDINFKSNNVDFNEIVIGWSDSYSDYEGRQIAYGNNNPAQAYYHGETPTGWQNVEYRTIEITDGNDAKNPDLLVWLFENAYVIPKSPVSKEWQVKPSCSMYLPNFTKDYENISGILYIGAYDVKQKESFTGLGIGENFDRTNQVWTEQANLMLMLDANRGVAQGGYKRGIYIGDDDKLILSFNSEPKGTLLRWLVDYAEPIVMIDFADLNLSKGNHTVKVKAVKGTAKSNFSNSLTYLEPNLEVIYEEENGGAGSVDISFDNGATWTTITDRISKFYSNQFKLRINGDLYWHSSEGGYSGYITVEKDGEEVAGISYNGTVYTENYSVSDSQIVNLYIYSYNPCFAENTKIKLADGTDKFVQDITYDDELLVWDFYEGKFNKAKPCWIKIEQKINHYSKITLDNGIVMRLVGSKGHRLFSLDEQKMLYSNEIVGHKVFTLKGIAKVISCERVDETVKFYNLTTDKYLDCFADDVLTGSRLNNMYHISDMKYDSGVRLISEEEEAERWRVRERLRK